MGAQCPINQPARSSARRTRPPTPQADITRSRESIIGIIRAIDALAKDPRIPAGPLPFETLRPILRRFPKDGGGFFATAQLIAGFRAFRLEAAVSLTEAEFLSRLRFRSTRTGSGVAPVAVFTKPFPCPGRCIFCPNDVRMPKSYLSDEPGAQRAEDNRFDPYRQTWTRLHALHATGHCVEKVELILLGGSWTFYPEGYQRWFVKRCFDALNQFDGNQRFDLERTHVVSPPRPCRSGESYNKRVGGVLPSCEDASWSELEEAQRKNENARQRCVGLSVETRPDQIGLQSATTLRRLGVTKVQVGVQSLDDRVLELNRRGHDVATTRAAITLLRRFGFKIHAHWMPNLLGSSALQDLQDFDRLFDDATMRPDELKIYPCSLIENAELIGFFDCGAWSPFGFDELVSVLAYAMHRTPRYARLTRVIRDIPATHIVAGNRVGNLREVVDTRLESAGIRCREIRNRELRRRAGSSDRLVFRCTRYDASVTEECFFEWVTTNDQIAAFLRLSLPKGLAPIGELQGSALIREVHVYGPATAIGTRTRAASQHRGLGRELIERAHEEARLRGFGRLSVISAIGTKSYYRSLGFEDGELYQHRPL